VIADLNDWFGRLVKENDPQFRHTLEGPDDMRPISAAPSRQCRWRCRRSTGGSGWVPGRESTLFDAGRRRARREVLLHLLGEWQRGARLTIKAMRWSVVLLGMAAMAARAAAGPGDRPGGGDAAAGPLNAITDVAGVRVGHPRSSAARRCAQG
jgi:hypothetical protein